MPLVEVQHLVKHFERGGGLLRPRTVVKAVDDVSFAIDEGETFGLVGAEAMSHGIPVIASRIGALAELIEDEVDGLLFEPGDARDLASKVKRLWEDADLCRRLGRSARAKALSLWTPRRHFERTEAVYEAVCASSREADAAEAVVRRPAGSARPTRVMGGSAMSRDAGD